jgi:hypothetical protein
MPALTKKRPSSPDRLRETEYRGKQTKTGNSSGFRFEGALFKSHPEFNGEVTAHVIAPGRLLVTAAPAKRERADPVMSSFLAFLAQDIAKAPGAVRALDSNLAARIDQLVDGIDVSPHAELGDEDLL